MPALSDESWAMPSHFEIHRLDQDRAAGISCDNAASDLTLCRLDSHNLADLSSLEGADYPTREA
jgi:hypothetical protein